MFPAGQFDRVARVVRLQWTQVADTCCDSSLIVYNVNLSAGSDIRSTYFAPGTEAVMTGPRPARGGLLDGDRAGRRRQRDIDDHDAVPDLGHL